MTTAILLTKEDITTVKIGYHYQITCIGGTMINFTPEALDEFLKDIESINRKINTANSLESEVEKIVNKEK